MDRVRVSSFSCFRCDLHIDHGAIVIDVNINPTKPEANDGCAC